MDQKVYDAYLSILKAELVPALGCTEPITIAYASAIARECLGAFPDVIQIKASGNIIKNVKSVVVPGTNGMKGIEAADWRKIREKAGGDQRSHGRGKRADTRSRGERDNRGGDCRLGSAARCPGSA